MRLQELPNDLESEKALLGTLLQAPERFMEIADALTVNDLFSSANQNIWKAMHTIYESGKEFDVPTLVVQIRQQEVDAGPTIEVLKDTWAEWPTGVSSLSTFVKQIKNKSLLRQIIKSSNSHSQTAFLEGTKAEELLESIEKDTLNIIDRTVDIKPVDASGIITDLNADIEKGKELGWEGYKTRFPMLDENTGGLIPTQTWIIGAYTGIGKTFLILQILLNVLRQGGKVVLFSTEMDRKINMLRLIGNIAGLGTIKMMRGNLDETEKANMEKAKEELRGYKDSLSIYDNVYTLEDIRLKTKKIKLSTGVNVVAIDFIQNLRGEGESIYERMSQAAVGLQQVAQELGVTLLIGSQVAQTSAGWQSKEAIEFKGAGEIAAVADVGLWILKSESDPSIRKIIIRKIRHGAPGKFDVRFSFPSGRVIDMESSSEVDTEDVKQQL